MAKKIQYHFLLSKEDENSGLKAQIDQLAGQKKLTAKIKTALTLLAQLEVGNMEMLDRMFPQIREQSKSSTPPDTNNLERQIELAVQAGIEKAMQNFPALPAGKLVAAPPLKQLAGSAPPTVAVKAAPVADAGAIVDNFMAFIQ